MGIEAAFVKVASFGNQDGGINLFESMQRVCHQIINQRGFNCPNVL
jgi:hypothetical protein